MNEQVMEMQIEQMPAVPEVSWVLIVVALALYVFWAYCIARCARKLDMPMGSSFIWALIPIANIFLLLKLSAKPMWWFILVVFVPFINFACVIRMWESFTERLGRPFSWGTFASCVPIWNIILLLILAFEAKRPPIIRTAGQPCC